MATEVKVPALGESIAEAVVMEWLVEVGDAVAVDQDLVTLETDKITVNVPSPVAGVLTEQRVKPDDEIEIGAVVAIVDETAEAEAKPAESAPAEKKQEAPASKPAAAKAGAKTEAPAPSGGDGPPVMPAVRRMLAEHNLDASQIAGSGRGGRVLKEDVQAYLAGGAKSAAKAAPTRKAARPAPSAPAADAGAREEIVPMSRLRKTVARRLVEAQQTAAILTTFNEVDMTAVKALRAQYRDDFEKKHGVRLGYTSFFAKAAIEALKAYPQVNAEIRDESIVYKNHYDIGVAVGGGRGLVVPVVRDADRLSFAGFEKALNDLAARAKSNTLTLEDLTGGTFTISNGGVYGSLLSTPILNPPQSGILGLHKIEDRPVAMNGEVVIRPMMYIALSYDHRIIDGRGAVSFLVAIKQAIEDPSRILLEV